MAGIYVLRSSDMGDGTDWVKLTRTGREVLRRLRADGRWLPVVLLTQVGESAERAIAPARRASLLTLQVKVGEQLVGGRHRHSGGLPVRLQ